VGETTVAVAWRRLALAIVVQARRDALDPAKGAYARALAANWLDSPACREWVEAWTGREVAPGWWQKRKGQR
jgi:hypothetical protein